MRCRLVAWQLGGGSSQLFAVLTTRAVYFYREQHDSDPDRYIKLEGLGARQHRSKGVGGAFELYSLRAEVREGRAAAAHAYARGGGGKARTRAAGTTGRWCTSLCTSGAQGPSRCG